jgi:hypothetical protein
LATTKESKRGGKKNPVYVRFGKAAQTPSARHKKLPPHSARAVVMRTPQPRSALHKYIAENADSGLTEYELIEQFQEYDCDHTREYPVLTGAHKKVYRCEGCERLRTVEISDAA